MVRNGQFSLVLSTRKCGILTFCVFPAAKSSLPVVKHAIRTEQISADNKIDRMSMWVRNVERE